MLEVGIIGGAGYTAGELIRLLLNHPKTNINFVYSTSNAGNKLYKVHQDLIGSTEISFTNKINTEIDVLFLCLGHGNSTTFLENNSFFDHMKIIDLSNDFRLFKDKNFEEKEFVYGLPELQRDAIKEAKCIANPGCPFALFFFAPLPLFSVSFHSSLFFRSAFALLSLSLPSLFAFRSSSPLLPLFFHSLLPLFSLSFYSSSALL